VTFHLTEVVTILLAAGVNPDLEDEKKLTALNIARIHSFDTENYNQAECRVADNILEMLKEYMARRALLAASVSMFGTLNEIPDAEPVLARLSKFENNPG
jgi:hypothetical protein